MIKGGTPKPWQRTARPYITTLSTTLSTADSLLECTTKIPRRNPLVTPLVFFVCITVLLLIIIIILVCRRWYRKGIIPTCACLQRSSTPQTEPDHGYVEPNNVWQCKIPAAAGRTLEDRIPRTESEDHTYINMQDNAYVIPLPCDNEETTPEPIPEVVYTDSQTQDIIPNAENKDGPIYQIIDPGSVRDSQTQ